MRRLKAKLAKLDRRGFGAYKELRGSYDFGSFTLSIDHVQSDPFAPPSRVKVIIPQEVAQFPRELFRSKPRRLALEDYLVRAFLGSCRRLVKGQRGSGKSGLLTTLTPSQAILPRTTAEVDDDKVIMRFLVGLPAYGRTIAADQAREMFFEEIPAIVQASLIYRNLDAAELREWVETAEDAEAIREQLEERGLVAFVADGAILPRESGVSQRPMRGAIPFRSPASLRVELELPGRGKIAGMGIPEGVTLIVGGGYHGKSTLLDALAEGIYNHIPGDGREFVVTRADAVKIRAEDGRFVEKVDISPFIRDLPMGISTKEFSTKDASGSTSQAANIIEALELGARVLLIDEDTSATNFLIRDERMKRLVAKEEEPITPLVEKVRPLYREHGVSTVMIMGGSGEFFEVADTVIKLREFLPYDVTEEAREIARSSLRSGLGLGLASSSAQARADPAAGSASGLEFGEIRPRAPLPSSIDPRTRRGGGGKVKIKVRDRRIQFGREELDLSAVEQLVEPAQFHTIGWALYYLARHYFDGKTTIKEALARLEELIDREGLLAILPYESCEFAWVRRFELAAALNRLRSLQVSLA